MTIDKYFPETLVKYSHISSSNIKPPVIDFIHKKKTTKSSIKSIRNLPFNKEPILKNDSISNLMDTSKIDNFILL
jgi:hypothetical protein